MDLQPSTEQVILADSAEKFLSDNYDFNARHAITDGSESWAADAWAGFAELGWLGLPFAEENGGYGGGIADVALLMEAFGRHLVVEPYLSTVVLCGWLVENLGTPGQRARIVAAIAEGRLRLAFVGGGADAAPMAAHGNGADYVLSGTCNAVCDAPMADKLLVPARLGKGGGTGIFVVERQAPGLTLRPYRTTDGGYAAGVEFIGVSIAEDALLGGNDDAQPAIDQALDRAAAALSADAVGAIAKLVEDTIAYTKTREQFGRPLSKFQVIQHRLVDMKVALEEARAITLFATLSADAGAEERMRAVSGAKSKVGRCARFVSQNAIQLHGAIGTTRELAVGNYVKRLMAYEIRFGDTAHHRNRYAALIADAGVAGAGLLLAPADT